MELTKIEQLLEAYFEGATSLQEEAILRSYFTSGNVAVHLQQYESLFLGFINAQKESATREIVLPREAPKNTRWWLGLAATLLVAVGVVGFFNRETSITAEEKEAIAAFEQTREAFKLMSQNLNTGAESLVYIHNFKETTNKILK